MSGPEDRAQETSPPAWELERLRPKLLAVAYRMLGSAADAEDAVQDALLKFHQASAESESRGKEKILAPEAWLVKATTRRCIDRLREEKRRRAEYYGPWLPEPVTESWGGAGLERLELAESLSTAFLVLLETLSPTERAAYLLREVFDYDYEAIAALLDKTAVNVRQITARAKKRLVGAAAEEGGAETWAEKPAKRFAASSQEADDLAARFFAACRSGDREAIEALLSPDAAMLTDGGGKTFAAPRPVLGAERVANFLEVVFRKRIARGETLSYAVVNGQPGAVFSLGGEALEVLTLAARNGEVVALYAMLNPEKLRLFHPAPPE